MKTPVRMVLLLLLAAAVPVAAQQPEGCAPLDAQGTLSLRCVDQPPQPDSGGTMLLRRILPRTAGTWAGFAGSFRIAFTVDTVGRVVRPSLRVLDLDSSRYAQRLPSMIARELRYRPAMRAGVPVPAVFEQRFQYRHPGDRGGAIEAPPLVLRVSESADPRGSTARLEWVPVASAPLPALDEDRGRERQVDALAVVLADTLWEAEAFACVALRSGGRAVRVTPDELDRLRTVRPRVATPGECPETYGSGLAMVNSDGTLREPPPGAGPDPYVVRVTGVVPWTEDRVVVALATFRSGGREILRCEQHRTPSGLWNTRCRTTARSVF